MHKEDIIVNKLYLISMLWFPFFVFSLPSIANVWSEVKTPYLIPNASLDTTLHSHPPSPAGHNTNKGVINSYAIGSYANGCLAGAKALPLVGEGYQVIRSSRKRYFGHPALIAFIQDFAKQLHQPDSDDLLIADISMPRGGNFVSGHSSHQIGLDVDIWFRQAAHLQTTAQKESPTPLRLVDKKRFNVNEHWQDEHRDMIKLAAENTQVARVFVNPAIKQKLCDLALISPSHGGNRWLNKVRPWWGHNIHMHVRLKCPEGDKLCQDQVPPEVGTGCDALSWWKQQVLKPAPVKSDTTSAKDKNKATKKPKPAKVKPEQCKQLLL